MKWTRHFMAVAVFASAVACSREPSAARADSSLEPGAPASVGAKVKFEPRTTVPTGTKLRVALLDGVSSDQSRSGDQFFASLTEPVVLDGRTVLAKGTKVRGRVVEAKESGRVKGRASLELKLTEIVRPNGKSIGISTKPYTAVAETTTKRDTTITTGGTATGAAIGPIAGGGKSAAIGALMATRGKEVRFGPEHLLAFALADPIEI